ncbi:protein CYPRO4-like [Hibiscus syriacus]|uniref:protein CYPRO4-like n=1 Tax=Hibiscus syriacus TaxID=106335 RepID=UPI0019234B48|nr:protein CYPRO4-like [Hibiscus syriacus]
MGGTHNREDLISDSDEEDYEEENGEEEDYQDSKDETPERSSSDRIPKTPSSIDEVETKLKALKLKYGSTKAQNPSFRNVVKLYLHIDSNTPKAKWVTSEKLTSSSFIKTSKIKGRDGEKVDEESENEEENGEAWWVLKIVNKIKVKVGVEMQLKSFGDQRRVDFVTKEVCVANSKQLSVGCWQKKLSVQWSKVATNLLKNVWARKFFSDEKYRSFVSKFNDCLFENTCAIESNDANRVKVYGKDFIGWAKPEAADDSIWEDAEDVSFNSPQSVRANQDLGEEFEEAANGGIQSLALGALDNSFLVGDSGIQVVKNFAHGIHGKGVYVNFDHGNQKSASKLVHSTPKRALLMKAETNMLLMSPTTEGKPHTTGLHQLDIETGTIVTEWKFGKDGTDVGPIRSHIVRIG